MRYFEIPLNLIRRTKYFDLSNRGKQILKENLFLRIFFLVNLYLKSIGLEIERLDLKRFDGDLGDINDEDVSEAIKKNQYRQSFRQKIQIVDTLVELNIEQKALHMQAAKDSANLSRRTYTIFKNKLNHIIFEKRSKLLSENKLNTFKIKMNKFYQLKKNSLGYFVDSFEKIKFTLTKILQSLSNQNIEIKNNVFNLHLSGDGCSISKTKINIVNFAFKVLNEGDQSLTGLYTLGNCIPYIFIN